MTRQHITTTDCTLIVYRNGDEPYLRLLVCDRDGETLVIMTEKEVARLAGCLECAACDADVVDETYSSGPAHTCALAHGRTLTAQGASGAVSLAYEAPDALRCWRIPAMDAWTLATTFIVEVERALAVF